MFRRFFTRESKKPNDQEIVTVPEIEDDQPRNNYTEVQILSGHPDLVDFIVKIDDTRIMTAHDKKWIVWNCKTGEAMCEMVDHKKTNYAVLVIENYLDEKDQSFYSVVVTTSADNTIKVWEVSTGECKKTITEHQSIVKCFCTLGSGLLLTAGQDICLWGRSFELLAKFTNVPFECIDLMIRIKENRIVVASTNSTDLVVYEFHQLNSEDDVKIEEAVRLPRHRRDITCLTSVSNAEFISASQDGSIFVWTSHSLNITKRFNMFLNFEDRKLHVFPFAVHHVVIVQNRFIFAAIGNGFTVFDTKLNGCYVTRVQNAHHSTVTSLTLLQKGKYLATSSLDGTVRLWSAPVADSYKSFKDPICRLFGKDLKECKKFPLKLELVGECCGHANSVKSILECGDDAFVSYDSDGLVVLWKDYERVQWQQDHEIHIIIEKMGWKKTSF